MFWFSIHNIYYYHPMVILAHQLTLTFLYKNCTKEMFIIVICYYFLLPKVRCKQMHCG